MLPDGAENIMGSMAGSVLSNSRQGSFISNAGGIGQGIFPDQLDSHLQKIAANSNSNPSSNDQFMAHYDPSNINDGNS